MSEQESVETASGTGSNHKKEPYRSLLNARKGLWENKLDGECHNE